MILIVLQAGLFVNPGKRVGGTHDLLANFPAAPEAER
jgi:hypothetical protein